MLPDRIITPTLDILRTQCETASSPTQIKLSPQQHQYPIEVHQRHNNQLLALVGELAVE